MCANIIKKLIFFLLHLIITQYKTLNSIKVINIRDLNVNKHIKDIKID